MNSFSRLHARGDVSRSPTRTRARATTSVIPMTRVAMTPTTVTMMTTSRATPRDVRARAKAKSAKAKARKAERAQKNKQQMADLAAKRAANGDDDEGEDGDDKNDATRSEGSSAPSGNAAAYESTDMVFHALTLGGSFKKRTGEKLLTGDVMVHDAAKALFNAPFCCASHDAEDTFNYGNKAALALWELEWEEFVGMKSTRSADEEDSATQEERRALLDKAASEGLITNYSGVRMSSTGKKFRIENATVWTMTNADGDKTGQAVRFDKVVRLNADGTDGQVIVVDDNGNWVEYVPEPEPEPVDMDAIRARIEELAALVETQANAVRELKDNGGTNADDDVKAAVKILLDLKAELSDEQAKLEA